jgi:CheY-like chemotaxis protein
MKRSEHEFVDESAPSPTREGFGQDRLAHSAPPDRRLGGGLEVLVVDDHPVHRRIAHTIFNGLGCAVTLAADGRTALATAEARAFDLVVMDPHMHGPSSDTTVRRLRRGTGPSRGAYVVCHSSDPPDHLFAGYDGVVAKPLMVEVAVALLAMVRLYKLGRSPAPVSAHPGEGGGGTG